MALSVPKFMVKIFIPREERKVVDRLTRGMRKVKVIYEEKAAPDIARKLDGFINAGGYTTYFMFREDGNRLAVYALEDPEIVHEIIMKLDQDHEIVIVSLQGKMRKKHFDKIVAESIE